MLSKFSVKKPFTVLVAVIMILVLGVISFSGMTTDLLPAIELPYIVVATAYPGASPEKVEATVTKPIEQSLGTVSGVTNITSTSGENSSTVIVEFVQGTNMESATIEMSGNIDMIEGMLPEEAGAPMMLKISPDMLPIMVASVDIEGMDITQISQYAKEVVVPAFERIDGVASVSVSGLVEEKLTITLNADKIAQLNSRVLKSINSELAKAEKELNDGKAKIADGQKKLADGKTELTTKKDDAFAKLASGSAQIDSAIANLNALLAEETTLTANKAAFEGERKLNQAAVDVNASLTAVGGLPALAALDEATFNMAVSAMPPAIKDSVTYDLVQQLNAILLSAPARIAQLDVELSNIGTRLAVLAQMKPQLQEGLKKAQDGYSELEKGKMTAVNELTKAEVMLSNTESELKKAEESMNSAQQQFEESRETAFKKADLDGIITSDMIANILKAQNFSMPAGYISEGNEKFLVKVGDAFKGQAEISSMVLINMNMEGIDTINLSDVADIQLESTAGSSYAKINGNDGIVMTFQKQSTASTATVSNKISETAKELMIENKSMRFTPLMDQGDYIDLIINSVLQNLIFGGILAIIVLAAFLKDIRPTFIVACSIPLSLMFAMTLMYFSNITLNMISLSGLALGVGMLVDNSIVVIENIYRLRSQGMSMVKAAVKGAMQVSGAIFASTLTTVCVFLPIVFTEGLSRQLFTDMGLTIAYSLIASLIVALTLVPAMGSTMLRSTAEKKHGLFDSFVKGYVKSLNWSLKHKAISMSLVVLLFVFSIYETTQMGLEFIPSMDSPQMSASITMPKDTKKDDAYALADKAMDQMLTVGAVETVGLMEGGSGMSIMGMGGSSGSSSSISFDAYVLVDVSKGKTNSEIAKEIKEATKDLPMEISVTESTMNMSALGGSGIEVALKGQDLDTMNDIAQQVREVLADCEGTVDISQPKQGSLETRVTVDKNKAMQHSLTVAQVYAELAKALNTESTGTTLTRSEGDLPVVVISASNKQITKQNLADFKFKVQNQDGEEQEILLKEIASITETESVKSISRDNSVRTMSVTAGVDAGHNVGIVGRELEQKIKQIDLPQGYTLEIKGENESINSSMVDLIYMVLLAIMFIYLIMVAQFQSLVSPFIVMFTIPLAFTGGLLALWICGIPLSVISMLGFLVLAGIVVNNGIVFVDYINQMRLEGMDKRQALLETGRARIRPVLMTALTTILAMSTMAMGVGMGAEMTQPMAIVTIGGLSYATVLTLFVVPIMYDIFRKKPMKNIDIGDED